MDWIFSALGFFATGIGVLSTIAAAASIVLIWDWRVALAGLFVVQLSLATFGVHVHGVSAQWAMTHILIILLCTLILALSSVQIQSSRSLRQPGNWLLRLLALIVMFMAWRLVNIQVALPEFPPNQVTFLIGLMLCALLLLGLGDNPLFAGVGLLLWIMPVQLIVEVLLPLPTLIAILGALQLLLALTCSYLVLADRIPKATTRIIPTDTTFPDEVGAVEIAQDDNSIDVTPLPGFPQRLLPGERDHAPSTGLTRLPDVHPGVEG